jgi:hypothetical protein
MEEIAMRADEDRPRLRAQSRGWSIHSQLTRVSPVQTGPAFGRDRQAGLRLG